MSNSEKVQKWRSKVKEKAIKFLGGKCCKCGYDKCFDALDFHHMNSDNKTDTISNMLKNPRKINLIIEEVKKCVLLCSNCHRELHCNLWKITDIKIPNFDETVNFYSLPRKKEFKCKTCGKLTYNTNYCSRQCTGKFRNKINWPEIKKLKIMLSENSINESARILGVDSISIKKHIGKKYPEEYEIIFGKPIPNWIKR